MPKVSICVPAYNNLEDVKRLIASIEKQTFKDYEVNVSDDSTNDEIKDFLETKEYVHYQKNEKPLGHIFNWNAAIKMASGQYIKIMFSDDWFTFEDSLAKLVELLDSNPEASLAFCGSRQTLLEEDVDKLTRSAGDHRESYDRAATTDYIEEMKKDYRYLFISNQIGCPSAIIYRRNTDGSVTLFDEKSNWASDVFLYFDIFKSSKAFAYSFEPLICVGMHVNQYTETFSEKDMRIYNDYKYMYNKYELKSEKKYRDYFLRKYIIKFNQGIGDVRASEIPITFFFMEKIKDFFESLEKFLKNHF